MQAAQFKAEQDHQRKVQLFFLIMLALLEQQLLDLKERCTPAALTADPSLDIEAQFGRVATAIRVSCPAAFLPLLFSAACIQYFMQRGNLQFCL